MWILISITWMIWQAVVGVLAVTPVVKAGTGSKGVLGQ